MILITVIRYPYFYFSKKFNDIILRRYSDSRFFTKKYLYLALKLKNWLIDIKLEFTYFSLLIFFRAKQVKGPIEY